MKTEKNILVAFILNIAFSIFELVGGLFTNSVSILSDAIHDFGDALSIGISYVLERKAKRKPDKKYTFGYARYSILGAFITTTILIAGSVLVFYGSIKRLIHPVEVNYTGMIYLAVIGVVINFIAAYCTKDGDSVNQKSVNLHMLEDVLGWTIVLIGSILMKFTDISIIDPIMSIGVTLFIFTNAIKNFKEILDLFLEKTPSNISIDEIKKHVSEVDGVIDVHHIHLWSMDGINNYATMHVVTDSKNIKLLKENIREEMAEHKISHVTIEIEGKDDECSSKVCKTEISNKGHHHHHH